MSEVKQGLSEGKQGLSEPPPAYTPGADDIPPAAPLYPNMDTGVMPQAVLPPPGVTTTTVIITQPDLSNSPMQMQCPNCHANIVTEIVPKNGLCVWLSVIGCCLIGCDLGCCFIPLCVDDLKDIEHRCPQCHAYLGTKKRL